jgi:type II secretory pathway pseudopilin PulG
MCSRAMGCLSSVTDIYIRRVLKIEFYQIMKAKLLPDSESSCYNSKHTRRVDSRPHSRQAFTLLELLTVLACLCFLAVIILPAFAGTSDAKSKALQCLQNQKQIMAAMLMYTQDNNDFLPPNPDDGNTVSGHNWCPGQAGIGGANEYDPDILSDKRYNLLAVYLQGQTDLYQCPADPRPVGRASGLSSQNPVYANKLIRPTRTVSMSGAVGTVCFGFKYGGSGHSGPPLYPVDGPWLNNTHSHRANQPWRTYGKTSQMVAPTPSNLFMLMDENTFGLNDSSFCFGMDNAEWIDFPGVTHEMSSSLAFADGRAEIHKWADARTRVSEPRRTLVPGSPDWLWMTEHTSARAQ